MPKRLTLSRLVFLMLVMATILTACVESERVPSRYFQTADGERYKFLYIGNMPCVVMVGGEANAHGLSCDWSKFDGELPEKP